MKMKNLYLTALVVIASLALDAQTVAVVEYMKVPENGGVNYEAIEKQWKTLHQSRVEAGKILAWHLWYVRNSGAGSPYNYVTVTMYENFNKTGASLTEEEFRQAFGEKADEVMEKTGAARSLVYGETYHLRSSIGTEVMPKFLVLNSIHTKNVDEYINMENVGYKPLHEASKKAGVRSSWDLWTRWPSSDNNVQAVVVDGYPSFENINNIDYYALFEKYMVGKKASDIMDMMNQIQRTDEIRTIVKSEIWEFVEGTTPKKM